MDTAIQTLLKKAAIKAVQPAANQFISSLFLVEKVQSKGEYRPIINLKPLNRFVEEWSFKMEGLPVVCSLIQPNDFMMKLDLKDAYYSVPVHPEYRRFLRFVFNRKTFEFQCLPFGLKSAPRAFTRLMTPVIAHIRSLGIRIVIYLDDILILHQDPSVLQSIFRKVVSLLEGLGFLINLNKCSQFPYLAIQAFTRNRKSPPAHIHLRIDNTTVVAYINKRGGGGGHTLTVSVSDSTGTVVLCPQDQILGDSNTYSRNSQCRCRHSISSIQPQVGMDIGLPDISEDSGSVLSPGGRSVCIKANPPGRELCLQISRSGGNSSRRISPRLEQVEEFHTPSCEPSSSSSIISPGNSTELAKRALVPTVSTDVGGLPPAASNVEISTIPPIRPPGPPSSVGNPQPGGMASIRRRFETAGFSPDVIEILLSSWSESTKKRYAGPWKAWAEWCTMRGWCPFSAPVTAVLSFLASLLKEKDLEYRTIAVYRSAISQTHDPIDSVPLGELPIVSKFMKGVFRAKPPKPKYCSSWNVAKVLDFLRNQEPLDKIPS